MRRGNIAAQHGLRRAPGQSRAVLPEASIYFSEPQRYDWVVELTVGLPPQGEYAQRLEGVSNV